MRVFFSQQLYQGKFCKVFKAVKTHSLSASSLSGRNDGGGSGSDVLGLVLSLGLDRLGGFLDGGSLLSLDSLLSGGSLLLLDGLLLLGLLNGLLVRLGGSLALDGSTELGERALLLVTLGSRAGGLVALAKVEGQRRLALLLLLLGIAVSHSNLDGLSRDGGRAGNIDGQWGSGLNGRDDGSSLSGEDLLFLGRLNLGLGLSSLLLLLREDVAEEAGALVDSRLLLGGLRLELLAGLGLTLGDRLSSGDLFNDRSLNLGDGLNNGGSLGGGGLLSLGLLLLLLLLAEAEERSALAASRAALVLLDLELVLGGLVLGSLLSLGDGLLSRDSSLLGRSSLLLGGLNLLLLEGRLEALNSLLVNLRLGDSSGELLGLSNLLLQLGDPVVALSNRDGLEAVLVALGSEVELVGAIGLGLSGIRLQILELATRVSTHVFNDLAIFAYQVDDAVGALLVTNEKKTLASVSSPGNVVLGNLNVLLSPLVGGEDISLDRLGAEVEEGLAGNQVPVMTAVSVCCSRISQDVM